jgi:c-di-GMP-binding flagellar brake protein YcgR
LVVIEHDLVDERGAFGVGPKDQGARRGRLTFPACFVMLPGKTAAMRERRKEYRVPEEDKVVLSLVQDGRDGEAAEHLTSLTRDISPGGACLVSGAFIPEGTRVRLEIALTGSRRLVRGTGTVRWVNRLFEDDVFEMGVEFAEIDPESIGAILEHVYGRADV